MELTLPLLLNFDTRNPVFQYGDLTGLINVVDENGKVDPTYSIVVTPDEDFEDEWRVDIVSSPDHFYWKLKLRRYWFRYNSKTGRYGGAVLFFRGWRSRYIHIKIPE